MSETITNMQDLCDYFYADTPASLNRHLFKYTNCGASISVLVIPEDPEEFGDLQSYGGTSWVHSGDRAWQHMTAATRIAAFTIQTIVEGSDATVDSEPFVLPVPTKDVDWWMQYMEDEAEMYWKQANEEDEEEV